MPKQESLDFSMDASVPASPLLAPSPVPSQAPVSRLVTQENGGRRDRDEQRITRTNMQSNQNFGTFQAAARRQLDKSSTIKLPTGPRKKCAHPQIENLRLAFESMDTNGTGKISFDIFMANSKMSKEVAQCFLHSCDSAGISGQVTFPKLVRIIYPQYAHLYTTHELPPKQALIMKEREEAAGKIPTLESQLKRKHMRELEELFRQFDKEGKGRISFEVLMEEYAGNGIFPQEELYAMLRQAGSGESLSLEQFIAFMREFYPTDTLEKFIRDAKKTFEARNRQRMRLKAQLRQPPTRHSIVAPPGEALLQQ